MDQLLLNNALCNSSSNLTNLIITMLAALNKGMTQAQIFKDNKCILNAFKLMIAPLEHAVLILV